MLRGVSPLGPVRTSVFFNEGKEGSKPELPGFPVNNLISWAVLERDLQRTCARLMMLAVQTRAAALLHLGGGGKVDVFLRLDWALKLRDSVSYIGRYFNRHCPQTTFYSSVPFLSTGNLHIKIRELISSP